MQTVEINIQLDPLVDGINQVPSKIKLEGKRALVIGTNGKYRVVEEEEAESILDRLFRNCRSNCLEHTDFLVVCNGKKIINTGDSKYVVGSVLIVKAGKNGVDYLTDEEVEQAKTEFITRLVTLCADGVEFSAYEMN